jgi:hypothetical protein
MGLVVVRKTRSQWELTILSVGLLLSVFVFTPPPDQYYMMAIPLVAMVSAHAVETVFEKNKAAKTLLVILAILVPLWRLANTGFGIRFDYSNRLQLDETKYVLAVTRPDDYVYDPDSRFNVFRKDLDFFWYEIGEGGLMDVYRSMTGYNYDIYRLIESLKPKVIADDGIDINDPRIASQYRQSRIDKHLLVRSE